MKPHACAGILLVVLFACISGCVTDPGTGSVAPVTSSPSATGLAGFALLPADVPQGFSLAESREKGRGEVSDLALDLGWSGGYVARYEIAGGNGSEITVLSQNIALYPAEKMTGIVDYVQNAERTLQEYEISDLPDPGIGDLSRAWVAYGTGVEPEPDTGQSGSAGSSVPAMDPAGSPAAAAGQDPAYYEIIFTKGDVFEVLRMSGPSADYTTLLGTAQAAYGKT